MSTRNSEVHKQISGLVADVGTEWHDKEGVLAQSLHFATLPSHKHLQLPPSLCFYANSYLVRL
jgi:hypothetical protein